MKRRFVSIALAAVAGCVLLGYAIPRAHPAATWGVTSDREQSIVKVRELSAALGLNANGWPATVTGDTSGQRGFFALHHPNDPVAHRFTPIYAKIALAAPGRPDRIFANISSHGDINVWKRDGLPKPSGTDPARARQTAESALQRFTGSDSATFHVVSDAVPSGAGLAFAWERKGLVTERFEATVAGDALTKAELKPIYTRDLDDARDAQHRRRHIFEFIAVAFDMAGILIAAFAYVYWAVRRAIRYRFVFAVVAAFCASNIIEWFNWGVHDQAYSALESSEGWLNIWGSGALMLLFLGLLYIVLAGAMDAVATGGKLATLRSLLSSSALNRRAGAAILCGLLCGPLAAGLPLLLSSLQFLHPHELGDYDAALIYSSEPALQAINAFAEPILLGLFGFGAAILARFVRNRKATFGALLVVGTLVLLQKVVPSDASIVVCLPACALVFVVYYAILQRIDVLAVLAAGYSAQVIWNASALLVQPARSLHVSGMTALGFLAAATLCTALVAWRGHDLLIEEKTSSELAATSQREALMAEFSIAHRVQQQMLPDRPPEIPGCSVAASCQPAREVGGDLFDFLQLADGRWTIAVGDVSGKGVPAALYMTLTKGLLIATTQDNADLVDIAAHLNGHIRDVAGRRTFVTMALGAFDPETRTFDHVRAGHNPVVWKRASDNSASFLNAPGIGLGIVSERLFRRATRTGRVELNSGDLLVFYSDGLTEAMNHSNEQFGDERLLQVVENADGQDAGAVRERILSEVTGFLGGVAPQDDMTIVVLRVN